MKQTTSQLLIWMLLLFSVAFGGTTGKLAGRVTDSQTGEPIIGANVTLTSTRIGGSTDIDGYYHIIDIPPGTYEVAVSCIGYRGATYRASIKVDLTTTLNISMTLQAVEMPEVLVRAERAVIQRDQSSTIQKAGAEDLETLPTNTLRGHRYLLWPPRSCQQNYGWESCLMPRRNR